MAHRTCVICFSPAENISCNISWVKWQRIWNSFQSHLTSTIISNFTLNKILLSSRISLCKKCFDSSMQLAFIVEEMEKLTNGKSKLITAASNGILQRRNASRIFLNPNVSVDTKKIESEGSTKNVVVENNANIETINLEEDDNEQSNYSPVHFENIMPTMPESMNEVQTSNPENAMIVETGPVKSKENGTDATNTEVTVIKIKLVNNSLVKGEALTPNVVLNRIRGENDEDKEKSESKILETFKTTSLPTDGKVKEGKQADNPPTGLPKPLLTKNVQQRKTQLDARTSEKKLPHIFNCQLCNTILKSHRNLETHITKRHNASISSRSQKGHQSTICPPASSKKSYKCSLCETKTFSTNKDLQQHVKTHKAEREFKCSICKKSFGSDLNLKAHEKTHSENPKNEYKCYLCVERFCTIERRTAHHEEIHNVTERSYECSVCRATFYSKNALLKHALIHTGVRKSSSNKQL